jgi:O-antigen/teichoic acid export membrane protein
VTTLSSKPSASRALADDVVLDDEVADRRVELAGDGNLREHAARGTLINGAFSVGMSSLSLLRGFLVAAFISRTDYGLWGILVVSIATLGWLASLGVGDKYVQQSEADQELAFQKAFTMELAVSMGFMVIVLATVPIISALYHQPRLLAPGLVVAVVIPAGALQAPLWIFYRRMQYVRQRTLMAVEPVVGFVVAVTFVIAGAGIWSLVAAAVIGNVAGAIAAVRASPYRLALRYDRGTLRNYWHFSWPLFVMSIGSVTIAQGTVAFGNAAVGVAGVGAIAVASQISQYTDRVDSIITSALYPAVCAIKDRAELMRESFVKSNRLAVMWGMPLGVGLALFAPDLVNYVLGRRWQPAIVLIQVFGAAAGVHQIGFNWDAYMRARGDTRPLAAVGLLAGAVFLASAVPLIFIYGLDGFAAGMAIMTLATLVGRSFFLTRIFRGLNMVRHIARSLAPTLPALGAVLLMRLVEPSQRTLGIALAELGVYLVVTIAATWAFERDLLREAVGYVRRRPVGVTVAG